MGDDQKQHLELCRDLAQKFNNDFGVDCFPLVEPLILGPATRVMSLRDGTKKMSKSDPSDNSRINLTDGPDAIARKIRRAKTDPEPLPGPDSMAADGVDPAAGGRRPEAFNLLSIYAALTQAPIAEVLDRFAGMGFADFKARLAEVAVETLGPIGTEMQRLQADPGHVDAVLRDGAGRARAIADPVLRQVHDIVGFLTP